MMSGRLKDSLNQLDNLFEIRPHFPDALALRVIVYQQMGDYVKAMDLFNEVQKIPGFEAEAYGCLGNLYFDLNQPEKVNEYLEKLLKAEQKAYHRNIAFHIAILYAQMDKTVEMFHFLNKSVENKENRIVFIQWYPTLRKYHLDPRFVELVKKIGLRK